MTLDPTTISAGIAAAAFLAWLVRTTVSVTRILAGIENRVEEHGRSEARQDRRLDEQEDEIALHRTRLDRGGL